MSAASLFVCSAEPIIISEAAAKAIPAAIPEFFARLMLV
jgi:hypothetical protein